MDFREALIEIGKDRTLKVTNTSGTTSYLVKVDKMNDKGPIMLVCKCIGEDTDWQPVSYLLSSEDYQKGVWEPYGDSSEGGDGTDCDRTIPYDEVWTHLEKGCVVQCIPAYPLLDSIVLMSRTEKGRPPALFIKHTMASESGWMPLRNPAFLLQRTYLCGTWKVLRKERESLTFRDAMDEMMNNPGGIVRCTAIGARRPLYFRYGSDDGGKSWYVWGSFPEERDGHGFNWIQGSHILLNPMCIDGEWEIFEGDHPED